MNQRINLNDDALFSLMTNVVQWDNEQKNMLHCIKIRWSPKQITLLTINREWEKIRFLETWDKYII